MRILMLFACVFCTFVTSAVYASLPSGYTQLEYLESTGTQYIDTGILPQYNLPFHIRFQCDSVSGEQPGFGNIFGGREASSVNEYQLTFYRDGTISVGGGRTSDLRFNTTSVHEITYDGAGTAVIDGSSESIRTGTISNRFNIYLFGINQAGNASQLETVKIYEVSFGNLFNGIPAKRNSDNVFGLYDTVTGTFYTNSGTGTFIAGPTVDIQIATTKYVETAFADSVSELNTTIGTIKNVVDNTIIQADRIGKLHTDKQNRPAENCPDGAQCLLITEADGSLHWYPICNADGTVGTQSSN